MVIITEQWLKKHSACVGAMGWYAKQKNKDAKALLNALINENKDLDWFNWYLSRKLKKVDRCKYAIYAAKQVLHIFEKKFPYDKRPRNAIMSAEKLLKSKTLGKKDATAYAACDANAADAADAAYAAACAAANDTDAVNYKTKMQTKICKYGLKLLERSTK